MPRLAADSLVPRRDVCVVTNRFQGGLSSRFLRFVLFLRFICAISSLHILQKTAGRALLLAGCTVEEENVNIIYRHGPRRLRVASQTMRSEEVTGGGAALALHLTAYFLPSHLYLNRVSRLLLGSFPNQNMYMHRYIFYQLL